MRAIIPSRSCGLIDRQASWRGWGEGDTADAFYVLSDDTIVAFAPVQAAGLIDVTVVSFSGTSSTSSADHYTYAAASAPSVTGVSASSNCSRIAVFG